jgi:hypothetical protein
MKKIQVTLGIAFIVFLSLSITSCEKDEEKTTPDYVGTWQTYGNWNYVGATVFIQNTLILTETSFESTIEIVKDNEVTTMFDTRGDLSASGNEFTIIPTSIGSPDPETGSIIWINKGENRWIDALARSGMKDAQTAEYSIVSNTLTLIMEADEPQVFTKQ